MKKKNNDGKIVLILIILLVAFGIGAATGIGLGLNGLDADDNTTHVENVTEEMTSEHSDPYSYDISEENINFIDYIRVITNIICSEISRFL